VPLDYSLDFQLSSFRDVPQLRHCNCNCSAQAPSRLSSIQWSQAKTEPYAHCSCSGCCLQCPPHRGRGPASRRGRAHRLGRTVASRVARQAHPTLNHHHLPSCPFSLHTNTSRSAFRRRSVRPGVGRYTAQPVQSLRPAIGGAGHWLGPGTHQTVAGGAWPSARGRHLAISTWQATHTSRGRVGGAPASPSQRRRRPSEARSQARGQARGQRPGSTKPHISSTTPHSQSHPGRKARRWAETFSTRAANRRTSCRFRHVAASSSSAWPGADGRQ
jgi:hypothetical protein